MNIRDEDITPRHRRLSLPFKRASCICLHWTLVLIRVGDEVFLASFIFNFFFLQSGSSNSSCEACRAAAAIRHTAEIVFLTVTGSLVQNYFPERSPWRAAHTSKAVMHFHCGKIIYRVLLQRGGRVRKSDEGYSDSKGPQCHQLPDSHTLKKQR